MNNEYVNRITAQLKDANKELEKFLTILEQTDTIGNKKIFKEVKSTMKKEVKQYND